MPQEPVFSEYDMDKMKADAIRRARQMHARARLAPQDPPGDPVSRPDSPPLPSGTKPPDGEYTERQPFNTPPSEAAASPDISKTNSNILPNHKAQDAQKTPDLLSVLPGAQRLAVLMKGFGLDSDRLMLLSLILLLSQEENTLPLLLALFYVAM